MSNSNAAVIRSGYEAFARGDYPGAFEVFHPDIKWHVPGQGPLSGDYTGHGEVQGFFQRTMELSQGKFHIDISNMHEDGDLVVTLCTVHAERNGVPASFPEVHVWRVKDGKAVEFREYQGDEQREDRFWS